MAQSSQRLNLDIALALSNSLLDLVDTWLPLDERMGTSTSVFFSYSLESLSISFYPCMLVCSGQYVQSQYVLLSCQLTRQVRKTGHTASPPGGFTVVWALYSFTHLVCCICGGGGSDVWLTKEGVRRLSLTG
jgi:hypothetical protein